MLKNKTVLLGISGGIAAYKSAYLASRLVKEGAEVHVIMTSHACNFINPITFETLTGRKCLVDTFDRNFEFSVEHVSIAKAADAYNAPFISGKDSFYNYFETENGPINVPVTFLCSGFGVVENPDHVIGSSLRRNNSLLYLIGHTEDEMGGSVFARTHGVEDGKVPQTDCAANMELYKAYYSALTSGLVLSAHDVSEGGLAVTAAEMAFSGKGGVRLDLTKVPTANGWKSPAVPLFSESTGRILVEVDPEFAADFETAMDGCPCACIGGVTEEKRLTATCCGGEKVLDCDIANLKKLWKDGLTPYY